MTDVNITIIGAGVVGLAIASQLSQKYQNVYVIEKNLQFGQEVSSRNSEVIHSGIYYPKGSLKAKLCVRGNQLLYQLCERESIAHRKCGKLIVANSVEEESELEELRQKGWNNGIEHLSILDKDQVTELEPNINASRALYSPSTGIIDSHGLMKYLENSAISRGVEMVYGTRVTGIKKANGAYLLHLKDIGNELFSFTTSILINCGGLEADLIAGKAGIHDKAYRIHFCKGEYFKVNPPKNKLVNRLIYPVPGRRLVSLGIHATVDLDGGLKLGPSAFYLNKNKYDYTINKDNSIHFFNSARVFFPFLAKEDLTPDMAGIRPKVQGPGHPVRDFIIRNEKDRGFPGFVNCIGIESPGLTSVLAIAEYVEELLNGH